jgi:iron(III) transport system substrate-binding protein
MEDIKMTKSLAVICSFLMTLILISPSSWPQDKPDPKVVEAAKKEAEVNWLTITALEPNTQIITHFQKRYPFIKPVQSRAGGGPLLNKITTEAQAGKHSWDVVVGRGEMFPALMGKKLLASYRSPELKMIDDDLIDKAGYWTAYNLQTWVLGYNTNLVRKEDVPKTYDDLLDPKWRKQKLSIDTEGYGWLQGLMGAWGRDKTLSYFKKLVAQDPALKRGNTLRVQVTAAGEYPLIITLAALIHRLSSKGAPIDWVPLEPAVVRINPVMLSANAPNPNAAKLFVDFLLSKEAQQILASLGDIPVRKDVNPDPPRLIRGYKRVIERPEGYKDLKETVDLYSEIFNLR